MSFAFVTAERPKSLQSQRKQDYQERLRQQARRHMVTQQRLVGDLYAYVVWFHSQKADGDVDNILKPILDALNGVVYEDDHQIVKCVAERINITRRYTLNTFPTTLNAEVFEDLLQHLGDEQTAHILYIEVGNIGMRFVTFGMIDGAQQ